MVVLRLEQKMSWVYLLNLTFMLPPLFSVSYSPWQYLWQGLAVVGFLFAYQQAYASDSQQMLKPVLWIILLAALLIPLNPGAVSMLAYASFFIGFACSLRFFSCAMLALMLMLLLLEQFSYQPWHYYRYIAMAITVAVGLLGRSEREKVLAQQRQLQSQDEIRQLSAMVERERIGRDLHDILGHTLSSIALKADLANKLLQKQQLVAAQQQLTELSQMTRDSLSQVRQSVSGYRHQGLAAEVAKLLARLRDGGFIAKLQGEIPTLDSRTETAVILALTELVTNVLRHSHGSYCELSFASHDQELQISVCDDGRQRAWSEGNGLSGVRERLAALNASLEIRQTAGCAISIRLPAGAVAIDSAAGRALTTQRE